MQGTISQILEPFGVRTSKAGKAYSAMKVEVETPDGQAHQVLSFEEKAVGDVVELIKNGEYWNLKTAPREKPADTTLKSLEFIMDDIKHIKAQVDKLVGVDTSLGVKPVRTSENTPQSGYDKARQVANSIRDKVIDPDEVDLSDIPF